MHPPHSSKSETNYLVNTEHKKERRRALSSALLHD